MDATAIMNALQSHALSLGHFSVVNGHEPKSPPQLYDQVNLMLWAGPLTAVGSVSGMNTVSYRWEVQGRVFMNAKSEPADATETTLITVTAALFSSLAAGFTLDGLIRRVDFYGEVGEELSGTPGYFDYSEETFRTMELVLPMIIDDVSALGA